jgi:outer membrane beta-barrel protein
MQTQTRFILSVGALALLASPAAYAEGRNPLAGQPAIRHRVEMRKMRFEVTPQFLMSVNQPYLIGVGGGVNLQFHLTDWFGIGASFHYTTNLAAPLEGRIEEALPPVYAAATDPSAGLRQPSKQMFRDHLVGPNMLIGIYGALTPIGGKFSLFNALFANYDFYGLIGAGVANLTTPLASGLAAYPDSTTPQAVMRTVNCTPLGAANDVNLQAAGDCATGSGPFTGLRGAGLFGIGVHIYFNHFIGINFELRDYMYKSNHGGLDVVTTDNNKDGSPVLTGDDEYIVNNLYFGAGITIMLPPTAKISR